MYAELIDRIAATIRRVDGNHTMGAASLAEAIVEDLENLDDGLVMELEDAQRTLRGVED